MSPKTATLVTSDLANFKGTAHLYRLSPGLEGHEYVIVSATSLPFDLGVETYIFPASEDGDIVDWGELEGSMKGTLSHATALAEAGYSIP